MEELTKAYVIKLDDMYLKKIGNSSRSAEYTRSIKEARIYASEKALDKHLLTVARSCSYTENWPEVLEFDVMFVKTIDHSERFKKNKERAIKAASTRRANEEKEYGNRDLLEVQRLEEELKQAKERLSQSNT